MPVVDCATGESRDLTPEELAMLSVSPEPPKLVTARQFKLQLLAADLIDSVEAWVGAQDRSIQIAYEYSGSFVRDEPMMQSGFAALGFTPEQIDAFFVVASKI